MHRNIQPDTSVVTLSNANFKEYFESLLSLVSNENSCKSAIEDIINLKINGIITSNNSLNDAIKYNEATTGVLFKALMENLHCWDKSIISNVVKCILFDASVEPALCNAIVDALMGRYDARYMAINAIGILVTDEEKNWKEYLSETQNPFIRAIAASQVKFQQRDQQTTVSLIKLLDDKSPHVICEAANSLSFIIQSKDLTSHPVNGHTNKTSKKSEYNADLSQQLLIALNKLLSNNNYSIFCHAAQTLNALHNSSDTSIQKDKRKNQNIAKLLLQKISSSNFVHNMNEIDDFDGQLHAITQTFIDYQSEHPTAKEEVINILTHHKSLSKAQRCCYISILGAVKGINYPVIKTLLNELKHPDLIVRYTTLKTLGRMKAASPRIKAALQALLNDSDTHTANYAKEALDSIESRNANKAAKDAKYKESIENLVFSGGGAAGYAYAGAIEALSKESSFSFNALKAVAGTSIGSIAALLVSLKYTPQEASNFIKNLNLKEFKDGGNLIKQVKRVLHDDGRFKGEALENFIKDIIRNKIPTKEPEKVTFADLSALKFLDLHVIADKICKINDKPTLMAVLFSADKTPLTSVVSAIRASAAAPLYFSSVKLKEIDPGHYIEDNDGFPFVDGGLTDNYLIENFDNAHYIGLSEQDSKRIINCHTLGLILLQDSQIQPTASNLDITKASTLKERISAMANAVLSATEQAKLNDSSVLDRTIQIDRLGVELADFDIEDELKEDLMQSGRDAVREYFSTLIEKPHVDLNMEQKEISELKQEIAQLKKTIVEQSNTISRGILNEKARANDNQAVVTIHDGLSDLNHVDGTSTLIKQSLFQANSANTNQTLCDHIDTPSMIH